MVQAYISKELADILEKIRNYKYPLAKLSSVIQEFLVSYISDHSELLDIAYKTPNEINKIKLKLEELKQNVR